MITLFRLGFLPIVSFRFRLCFQQDLLLVGGGLISSYGGEGIEGLTEKVFEILILFGRTGHSLKIVDRYFKCQGVMLMFDFAPERSLQPREGADFKAVF